MPPRTKTPTKEQRKQVKTLSGFGLSQDQIALVMQIDRNTLAKYYKEELVLGKAEAFALATNSLFSNIKKGKEASIFFYLKCQHRWSEKAPELSDDTISRIVAGVGRSRSMSHEEWTKYAQEQKEKSKRKLTK
jgi:hypothetical protein